MLKRQHRVETGWQYWAKPKPLILLTLLVLQAVTPARAEVLRLAVASNFRVVMQDLEARFQAISGHSLIVSYGSTGKLYAQIINGAPHDIFMAADSRRPLLLEQQRSAAAGTRRTYARGRLVLWSPVPDLVDAQGEILGTDGFRRLSIANPRLAPYGAAAREVLIKKGRWKDLSPKLVRGENIAQTFQFVESGNAELGFVARSQIKYPGRTIRGSYWEVPQGLHEPIEQQMILLSDNESARAFYRFMQSDEVLEILQNYGYDTP